MQPMRMTILLSVVVCMVASLGSGQEYDKPDRGQPGDEMVQQYLSRETQRIHEKFAQDIESREKWEKLRPTYRQEYLYMLGLWPMPQKSPLKATVTGTLERDGYVVDMLHYQSVPGLYVTGNLYRPSHVEAGQRLPAVLYVCGHSFCGRNGNKTAYQSHGIWFARHGYICLVLDSLQLGEIAAIHHGTYREGRWWWHSRGYTPAGVECLNGIRGIDYLIARPDVDSQQIAVTGISGGGAATFWIAAADERVKVAVPVSGMADLPSYVSNRVINGHCDCMFLYNTFQWPWIRIAGLIAPRALLFTNSDQDSIFPMDANQRVINNLERLYSLYGAGDFVDSFVSIGGHAYRKDIRQAACRFINMHLKNDPRVVEDRPRGQSHVPHRRREAPRLSQGFRYPKGRAEHDHRPPFRADGQGRAAVERAVRCVAGPDSGGASPRRVRVFPRANPAGSISRRLVCLGGRDQDSCGACRRGLQSYFARGAKSRS
jgi:dienelactone hydrolase